jgi:hypothetical protein
VQPVSRASHSTTSSRRLSRTSAAFRKIACRTAGGVRDHSGKAAAAASTAARASSRVPAATWATTSPVKGSVSSNRPPSPGSTHSPPMKCRQSRMLVSVALMSSSLAVVRT